MPFIQMLLFNNVPFLKNLFFCMIFKSVYLSEKKIYDFTIHTMKNICNF